MVIQGTTPTHVFSLPFDKSNVKDVIITYYQENGIEDGIVFVKKFKDCVLQDNQILVDLSQTDTFALSHKYLLTIELKVLTANNKVLIDLFENIRVQESKNKEEFNI